MSAYQKNKQVLLGALSLYSWRYPFYLLDLWAQSKGLWRYIRRFWTTGDFSLIKSSDGLFGRKFLVAGLYIVACLQIAFAIGMLLTAQSRSGDGVWQFALALLLAYPIVLAHALPLLVGIGWLLNPKKLGREILCRIMESQVVRLRKRHDFKVIAVAGSVGKTSTKIAVANLLSASRRVCWQEGNYNDRVTVPLIFFGHPEPHIYDIPAWIRIMFKNEQLIRGAYPHQVVVAELGPDGPGQMKYFAYLKPDLAILTAISPEHMAFFKTLDAVAKEELTILSFSKQALVNLDDTPKEYLKDKEFISYGLRGKPDYMLTRHKNTALHSQTVTLKLGDDTFKTNIALLGDQGAKITLAAASAAHLLDIPTDDIKKGIDSIKAFAGRMQVLPGIKNSTLIDDTYNSTPIAAKAALDVLYNGDASQRIAILGSMNELGDYSEEAHREVALHCDPSKLAWVITVGKMAKEYLAPIAKKQGCKVKSFLDPYRAGRFVEKQLQEGGVVLAKGSQNGVFAEEALKTLLADPEDATKLVRQSEYWMTIKRKQFKR